MTNIPVFFKTEKDFRIWFDANLSYFGVKRIILSQEVCPDYVLEMTDGMILKVEAELFSINFKYHNHDPRKVDLIISAYSNSEKVEGVPVVSLHKFYQEENYTEEILSPNGRLTKYESQLLGYINGNGGISLTALGKGYFSGDYYLYQKIPDEILKNWPRGKIEENIFNFVTEETKKFAKKYHHVLLAVNLAEKTCKALHKLKRMQLIEYRPLRIIASLYDGVYINSDSWLPTEVIVTKKAWSYKKEQMMRWHPGFGSGYKKKKR